MSSLIEKDIEETKMTDDSLIEEVVTILADILSEMKRMANAMEAPLVPGGLRDVMSDEELDKIIGEVFQNLKE